MQEQSQTEVLARVNASLGRRVLGLTALSLLGILVIYVALAKPPALVWRVFLIGLGAGALWLADSMRRATSEVIELTETELRDTSGEVIARVADI